MSLTPWMWGQSAFYTVDFSLFTPVLFFMRHVNMSSAKKCSSFAGNSAILTNNCHIFEFFYLFANVSKKWKAMLQITVLVWFIGSVHLCKANALPVYQVLVTSYRYEIWLKLICFMLFFRITQAKTTCLLNTTKVKGVCAKPEYSRQQWIQICLSLEDFELFNSCLSPLDSLSLCCFGFILLLWSWAAFILLVIKKRANTSSNLGK